MKTFPNQVFTSTKSESKTLVTRNMATLKSQCCKKIQVGKGNDHNKLKLCQDTRVSTIPKVKRHTDSNMHTNGYAEVMQKNRFAPLQKLIDENSNASAGQCVTGHKIVAKNNTGNSKATKKVSVDPCVRCSTNPETDSLNKGRLNSHPEGEFNDAPAQDKYDLDLKFQAKHR